MRRVHVVIGAFALSVARMSVLAAGSTRFTSSSSSCSSHLSPPLFSSQLLLLFCLPISCEDLLIMLTVLSSVSLFSLPSISLSHSLSLSLYVLSLSSPRISLLCLSLSYVSLSIHCLFTAYSLPIHCLFTVYAVPIHSLPFSSSSPLSYTQP
jgi:hypothetical protein